MICIFCLERSEILLERAERRVNISPSSFQFRGEVKRFDSNRFNWTISRHCPWTVTKGRPRYFTAVEEWRDVTNIVAEREQSRTRVSQMAIGVYRHPPYLTPGQSLPPPFPSTRVYDSLSFWIFLPTVIYRANPRLVNLFLDRFSTRMEFELCKFDSK